MLDSVLGICGWKNSGKTTLIEALIPALAAKGLSVAVLKHDTHGIEIDRPGKDSDRFFRAGADVVLEGPGQAILRCHDSGRAAAWEDRLADWCGSYDLILVEGHKDTALPKIWLNRDEDDGPPESPGEVLLDLPLDSTRVEKAMALIDDWLPQQWQKTPLLGCLLIGGKSRRMGEPKHLMTWEGETWIERIAQAMEPVVGEIVIAGSGDLPAALKGCNRLVDAPEASGPIAGILAAMRWNPDASWIVAACDMPLITTKALEWLVRQRGPGRWMILPRIRQRKGRAEPMLAYYDARAHALLESIARTGDFALHPLSKHPKAITPQPAEEFLDAWRNYNEPSDLPGKGE